MTNTVHLTAFCPSHTTRPALPQRGGRGIRDFAGIPQISDADDSLRPLFADEQDRARDEEMAAAKEAIRQRAAETYGGTWSNDLR